MTRRILTQREQYAAQRIAADNYSTMMLDTALKKDGHLDTWLEHNQWLVKDLVKEIGQGDYSFRDYVGNDVWDSLQDSLGIAAQNGDHNAYTILDPHRQKSVHEEWEHNHNTPDWYTGDNKGTPAKAQGSPTGGDTKSTGGDTKSAPDDDLVWDDDPFTYPTYGSDMVPDTNRMTLKELLDSGVDSTTVKQWLKANPIVHNAIKDPKNPSHQFLADTLGEQLSQHLQPDAYPHFFYDAVGKSKSDQSSDIYDIEDLLKPTGQWFEQPQDYYDLLNNAEAHPSITGDDMKLMKSPEFHKWWGYQGGPDAAKIPGEAIKEFKKTLPPKNLEKLYESDSQGLLSEPKIEMRGPAHLDSPLFPADQRPILPDGKSFFSPNDYNPVPQNKSRPAIRWNDDDFEEDEVLPGMPTENRNVLLYRGDNIDLRHPGAQKIRELLNAHLADGSENYRASPGGKPPELPGMETGQYDSPIMRKMWESPKEYSGSDDEGNPIFGDSIHKTKYHNPELGPLIAEHWEKDRPSPWGYAGGLGRHWTLSPNQAQSFAGDTGHNNLAVRFVAQQPGYQDRVRGENPDRPNTGGEYGHEKEINQVPGSAMNIVDVQIKHPTTMQWISAWPKGETKVHYSSLNPVAEAQRVLEAALRLVGGISDEDYAARLQYASRALNQAEKDGRLTHVEHAGPINGWTAQRDALHQKLLTDAWSKFGEHIPRNRQAIIMGGLPASRKSTILKQMDVPGIGIAGDNVLTLDPDYFKQEMAAHGMAPEVPGLSPMETAHLMHQESLYLTHRLAEKAYKHGTNVAWDGTLRYDDTGPSRLAELTHPKNNYTVHGAFMDIPIDTSVARASQRHREGHDKFQSGQGYGGRLVPEDYIRGAVSPDPQYNSINRMNYDALAPKLASSQVWDTSTDTPVKL